MAAKYTHEIVEFLLMRKKKKMNVICTVNTNLE